MTPDLGLVRAKQLAAIESRQENDAIRIHRNDDALGRLRNVRGPDWNKSIAVTRRRGYRRMKANLEITRPHTVHIDEKIVDLSYVPAVPRRDLPSANVDVAFGHLEVTQSRQRSDAHAIVAY